MSSCPDCKDGFYYPFMGPPEPCQTCKTKLSENIAQNVLSEFMCQMIEQPAWSLLSAGSGSVQVRGENFMSKTFKDLYHTIKDWCSAMTLTWGSPSIGSSLNYSWDTSVSGGLKGIEVDMDFVVEGDDVVCGITMRKL